MTKYDDLLKEAKSKLSAIQQSTARDYIPRMYTELRKENSHFTPEKVRERIEKDCIRIWSKRTILDALPDEAKNPKRQELGRLGQKKRNSAAFTAAPEVKRQVIIDTQGQSILYDASDERIESSSKRPKVFDGIREPNDTKQLKCPNCVESETKIRELEEALSKATVPTRTSDIPNTSSNNANNIVQFEFELPLEIVRVHVRNNFKNKIRDKVWFYGSLDVRTGKVVTADVGRSLAQKEQETAQGRAR